MSDYKQNFVWLIICLLTTILCLQACTKQKAVAADKEVPEQITDSKEAVDLQVKKLSYANDIDRLNQITERINRACRKGHVVVLGGAGIAGSDITSVDYALFDKLSDDGAAVLIAQAITEDKSQPSPQMQNPAPGVTISNSGRDVLQRDEIVGSYIARAGFSSGGFAEWLWANKLLTSGPQQIVVSSEARISAFMRGYSLESKRINNK